MVNFVVSSTISHNFNEILLKEGEGMSTNYPLTDSHFEQLVEDGYVILKEYIPKDELAILQAAQRSVLKTWEEVKENPPTSRAQLIPYPYQNVMMSKLYLEPDLIDFGRRYLKTQYVQIRVGNMIARYPGFKSQDAGHIDNGNNSLLPKSESCREFGQIVFWIHLEETTANQAPLLLVKKKYGNDLSKAEPFVCPAGSIAIFSNYTFHASSSFNGQDGQRFTWAFMLGRADHPFEGLLNYTALGINPIFKQVISSLTPSERTLFCFPPPGHHYYTKQTLKALEEQYPGFNKNKTYKPVG